MSTYSGSMSIYFPGKLKLGFPVNRLNDRWNRWRKRQIDFIHHSHTPLTDLMDRKKNRDINEAFLKVFQKTLASNHSVEEKCAPYGLRCLQSAYRKKREDNIFSKNVQLLLSRFKLEYCIKNKNKTLTSEGCLLLNVNADNSVATFIVVLNFVNCCADDIIYLKHVFYKRLLVSITEYGTESQNCDCSNCNWMECQKIVSTCQPTKTTVQNFVNRTGRRISLLNKLEYDFDYRARYSFVKLVDPIDKFVTDYDEYLKLRSSKQKNDGLLKELYGILSADECFSHFPRKKLFDIFKFNNSTRMDYDLYTSNLNALIVTRKSLHHNPYCRQHAAFRQGYDEPDDHIKTEQMVGLCIPGLLEGRFPSFLKAVEVHYLINKVTTNEIAIHERSFLNPFIFLKRLWLLWEILYDVDSHKYHVSRHFQETFGISKQLEDVNTTVC